MSRLNVSKNSNLLGYYYPFFIDNVDLTRSHFLYKLITPGLDEKLVPTLSMYSVSERISPNMQEIYGDKNNLLAILGSKDRGGDANFIKYLLRREKESIKVSDRESEFPEITMQHGNSLQKSMIVNLRDAIRWKQYRFTVGRKVDVLWSTTQFMVMTVCGEGDNLWLEPVALYDNSDILMKSPVDVDVKKLYNKEIFSGKGKIGSINHAIKGIEWGSFSKNTIRP